MLVKVLQPVKIVAEKLCHRDATILTTEALFNFMFSELRQQDTPVAKLMISHLTERIGSRSNKELLSLGIYLKYGKKYTSHQIEGTSKVIPKSTATSNAKKMFVQYNSAFKFMLSESEEIVDINMTLSVKLQTIMKKCNEDENLSNIDRSQHIVKELAVFELTKERTNNISKLYEAVKSVPPTSVEAERAFSAACLFITKLRSRLSDKSINALCLLRSHFMT